MHACVTEVEMLSVMTLGFLIGMHHALEADHVAAVCSMVVHRKGKRNIAAHGLVWGLGHTLTLMVFAGAVAVLGSAIDADVAAWLETAAAAMLVVLGGHVLYRLWQRRIHFHTHRHRDGTVHFHAHAHDGTEQEEHHAVSPAPVKLVRGRWRTLVVGMIHGMAGSAALVALTASAVGDWLLALFFVLLFGLGSMIGMGLLSAVIAIPLSYSARSLSWGHRGIQALTGAGTVALGISIIIDLHFAT
jgi:ABC-type nickel/cobalt efflux system permease component RcnA